VAVITANGQSVINQGSIISIQGAQFTVGNDLTNEGTIINNGNLLISGAWINNGTYDPGTGQITFNSPAAQIVNHNDQAFKRLTISGGGVKQFLANITIEDELILSDGNLVSENGAKIIIQPGANISGGSDESHIVGPVEHEGEGNWLFPVGNGSSYLPVEIMNVSDNSARGLLVLHELQGESLTFQNPLIKLSGKRFWELNVSQGNLSGAMISLPLRDEENLTGEVALAVVAQSDNLDNPFESLGQYATSGDLSIGTVTGEGSPSKTFYTAGAISGDERVYAFNGVSPNGDLKNDFFKIANIEKHPQNLVTIFSRWGDKVFELTGYDNDKRVFVGENNISGAGKLPSGTYFYRIELGGSAVTGYLVLKF
jgi:gliding motility-associated-like protein